MTSFLITDRSRIVRAMSLWSVGAVKYARSGVSGYFHVSK